MSRVIYVYCALIHVVMDQRIEMLKMLERFLILENFSATLANCFIDDNVFLDSFEKVRSVWT